MNWQPKAVIDDRCYHIPTAPGQGVCSCLDALMWTRLLVELLCRRVAELELEVQTHKARRIL